MIRKLYILIAWIVLSIIIVSCGAKPSQYVEVARERAVEAAKAVIATPHDNISKMERVLLETKAMQSEYMLMGDTIASQAFEDTFKQYIITHDSILANEIF